MTVLLWMQFVVGLLVFGIGLLGLFGLRPIRQQISLLGLLTLPYPAAALIGNSMTELRLPALIICGIFLLAVMPILVKSNWRQVRWIVLSAAVAVCVLVTLQAVNATASPATRMVLLASLVMSGASFIAVSVVTVYKGVAQLRR